MSILLDSNATDGQLLVARFGTREGVGSPYHMHTREDEVFMIVTPRRPFEPSSTRRPGVPLASPTSSAKTAPSASTRS